MPDSDEKSGGEFFDRFLEDYFAECDEHLTEVRRDLLALELYLNKSQIDRTLLDRLFRSFHTIKGISGMVGLGEAEQLAHEVESYLRLLRQAQSGLTNEGLEALISGTTLLEQVIGARRTESPIPDVTLALARIAARSDVQSVAESSLVEDGPDNSTTRTSSMLIRGEENVGSREATKARWRFEFLPTPALAERGFNVNSVRTLLQGIGEILRAAPLVKSQGEIAFEFFVASDAQESAFAVWQENGLTYTPVESVLSPTLDTPSKTLTEKDNGAPSDVHHLTSPRLLSNTVRVDLERLNDLMLLTGSLIVSRARLERGLKSLRGSIPAAEWRSLQEINAMMGLQLRDLRKGVMRVRMVPIGESFERMRFVVRDMARENQKKVILELSGENTEIDKLLVERMMDPLLHLVRNAVSHGLESAAERISQSKPPQGRVALRASTVGETVVIEIEDDGRGIDVAKVAARGRERGLVSEDAQIDDATIFQIISAPSFSTRDDVDRESGRGVGMDVVRSTVQDLNGSIKLATTPGRGTRFTIELPLTLAITDALLVTVGGQTFAIPQSLVREIIEIDPRSVKVLENGEIISHRGDVLPLVHLAQLFHLTEARGRVLYACLVGDGANSVALAVERVLGQREIVVRAISDPLIQVPGVAGATDVGDGRLVLILDIPKLLARDSLLYEDDKLQPWSSRRGHNVRTSSRAED